jgi:hypothetical protein
LAGALSHGRRRRDHNMPTREWNWFSFGRLPGARTVVPRPPVSTLAPRSWIRPPGFVSRLHTLIHGVRTTRREELRTHPMATKDVGSQGAAGEHSGRCRLCLPMVPERHYNDDRRCRHTEN